ncbi:hypothetical protein PENANT_c046G05342 [Penicillium antarcticum]|uniref:Uncharacterized protein n=1 Tax=Penicillium antarcticum TaxID=416450 RepID=A0A1V6PRN8_9EURO|nr:hypothetical protein PENANT_c046G05342 [Penicillium antarcticum]
MSSQGIASIGIGASGKAHQGEFRAVILLDEK